MALLKYLPRSFYQHATMIMHTITIAFGLLALHLLTFPDEGPESTPGYARIVTLTPGTYGTRTNLRARYWLALGATLLLVVMSLSPSTGPDSGPLLQRPFTTRFAQYLGSISFGLYVTHLYVIYTIGSRFLNYSKDKALMEYIFGFLAAAVVNSFLAFWIADLFWRGVDSKSVLLAKWVAEKCFVKL